MKNIFQPYWIILTLSLPIICLMALFGASYQIVESLLSPENLQYWYVFGALNAALLLGASVFALYAMFQRKLVPTGYILGQSLLVMLLMAGFMANSNSILPSRIPRWMLSEQDLILYGVTFYMPSLLHALLLLIVHLTPRDREHSLWFNMIGAFAAPLFWYLFFLLVIPLLHTVHAPAFANHVVILWISLCTFFFVFFLLRGVLVLAYRFPWLGHVRAWIWQVPIGLIAPSLGLWLNNEVFDHIFGNFTHPLYYIIPLLNGIVLMMPNSSHLFWRGLQFILRSIGFSYIIYFVLVMLPYAGLTIPAVIFFGTGLLMLAPLAIGLWQAMVLYQDFQFLKANWGSWPFQVLFALSFAALPLTIILNLYFDRQDLHKALDYALGRDYRLNQSLDIHPARIKRSLTFLRGHQVKGSMFFNQPSNYQPYISPLYNWMVLDNLTLSQAKLHKLERLYLGEAQGFGGSSRWRMAGSDKVVLDCLRGETVWDEEKGYYRSWVHLTMHNTDTMRRQEFFSEFNLVPGAWISNYYLDIEGRKEFGLLAERKAAQWVYQQIVRTRRDPGIVYYNPSGSLDIRVFPLAPQQTRYTGLEIIHREPFTFELDGLRLDLDDPNKNPDLILSPSSEVPGVLYLPKHDKSSLKLVQRRPHYYFILDASAKASASNKQYIEQIQSVMSQHKLSPEEIQVSMVNYEMKTIDLSGDWSQSIMDFPRRGGLDLDFALKSIIWKHYENSWDSYPLIFLLTSQLERYAWDKDLVQFTRLVPEKPPIFCLDHQNTWQAYAWDTPQKASETQFQNWLAPTVRAYPNPQSPLVYLNKNNSEELLPLPNLKQAPINPIQSNSWEEALALQAQVYQMEYYPESYGDNWLKIVQNSFRSKILSPHTSYIALENEAQKQALLAKQAQILKANKHLDADDEDLFRMSEPSEIWFWVLATGLVIFFYIRKRRLLAAPGTEKS